MSNRNETPFNLSADVGAFDPAILGGTVGDLTEQLASALGANRSALEGRIKNDRLNGLRAQVPFTTIVPLPDTVVTGVLAANTPQDFRIPSACQMVRFKGNGDYYVSANGNAQVPLATDTANQNFNSAMYKPEEFFYFVGEAQSVSIVAPNANTIVTMQCFIQM